MTGALAALMAKPPETSGGTTAPTGTDWRNVFGQSLASTQILTMAGFTATITITAAITGGAGLAYVKNGVARAYTGAFTVVAGDTLGWQVSNYGMTQQSGTVTVTNATVSTTMDTFNYVLVGHDTN